MFINIDPITKNVLVRHIEPDVVHFNRNLAAIFFIKEYADLQASGLACFQHLQDVCKCSTAVDDIFDEQNIQAFNVGHQVKIDAYITARCIMSHAIGRERHAIEGMWDGEMTGQVSGEHQAATQQANDQ